jgi:hypothetical protein
MVNKKVGLVGRERKLQMKVRKGEELERLGTDGVVSI